MRWKIREFTFCDEMQTLSSENSSVQLEPLMVELLSYLCHHPNEVLSRDQLVEAVWHSEVVSDNAVNRVISKLRKVLGDDARSPRFIATLPKKGYLLIAAVTVITEVAEAVVDQGEDPEPISEIRSAEKKTFPVVWRFVLGIALLSLMIGFWTQFEISAPAIQEQRISVLTRGGGRELQPSVSPDGKHLIFTSLNENQLRLYLKDLSSQDVVQISRGEGNSGGAMWSKDGKYVVYLYNEENLFQFHRIALDGMEVIEREVIHNSPVGSFGRIAFTHENHRLIYSEAEGPGQPYSIFELDIETSTKIRLPQPELINAGNLVFDLHPKRNELLIASPDPQQWLAFYRLDLDARQLNYMFKLNEFVCCPIWDGDGDRVILMGEHPAYELISFDLLGRDRRVVYQAPHRVDSPARFGDQQGFVYVGGVLNRDISAWSFDDGRETTLVDTSVDDRLAVISPDGNLLAYLSDRSGPDEVWLYDIQTSRDRKLTNLNNSYFYTDLKWAPDGNRVVLSTLNELHMIELVSGAFRKLKIPQTEIHAVSWKDNETLSFSTKANKQWRVNYYQINHDRVSAEQEPWAYIHYAPDEEDILWISQSDEPFYGPQQKKLDWTEIQPLSRSRFNLVKQGNKLYFFKRHNRIWQLHQLTLKEEGEAPQASRVLWTSEYFSTFSLNAKTIYFTKVTSYSADIYRVSSPVQLTDN